MSLERGYKNYIDNLYRPYTLKDIDFFGINLNGNGQYIFKTYYSQNASILKYDRLYGFLNSHDMINYYENVVKSGENNNGRMEFGLKNRNDHNFIELIDFLNKELKISSESLETVKRLAAMKITDKRGYKYSSLYFIGMEEQRLDCFKLKLHFYSKFCEDPEILLKGSRYRDIQYLAYIKSLGIQQLSFLHEKVALFIKNEDTHLWMTALDIGKNNKYKIYIKMPANILIEQRDIFDKDISVMLDEVNGWYINHKEYFFYGTALCLTDDNIFSLNLYFMRR